MALGRRSQIRVDRGEKLLADAVAEEAHLGGTRDALYVVRGLDGGALALEETVRIPWEDVQAADWDAETSTLRVSEVGTWGEPRPEHVFTVPEPGRLLELVRERVTASVVLQRHVPVRGSRGLRVVARRAPRGDRPITWIYEFDAGIDPDDPAVRKAAEEALAEARAEVGLDFS
jgi:hypothetical protein